MLQYGYYGGYGRGYGGYGGGYGYGGYGRGYGGYGGYGYNQIWIVASSRHTSSNDVAIDKGSNMIKCSEVLNLM